MRYTTFHWESITISSLISYIEDFSVCNGIDMSSSNINVMTHVVQKVFDPFSTETSPVNQDVFYRSKKCMMFTKSHMCPSCTKCLPIVVKAEKI